MNVEQQARALYESMDNKVVPTWDQLGETTKSVWRERVLGYHKAAEHSLSSTGDLFG